MARDEARNIKGAVSFNDDIVKHLVSNANTTSIIVEERALCTLISEFGRVALASAGRHEEDAMDVGVSKGDNWGESFAVQVFTCPLVFQKLLNKYKSEDSPSPFLSAIDAKFFAPTATLFLRALSTTSSSFVGAQDGEEGYSRTAWMLVMRVNGRDARIWCRMQRRRDDRMVVKLKCTFVCEHVRDVS